MSKVQVEIGPQGQLILSTIMKNGEREHRQYFGYTKSEAMMKFILEVVNKCSKGDCNGCNSLCV